MTTIGGKKYSIKAIVFEKNLLLIFYLKFLIYFGDENKLAHTVEKCRKNADF